MRDPLPRYASVEMPLKLRRRQRQNVADAKHVGTTPAPAEAPAEAEPTVEAEAAVAQVDSKRPVGLVAPPAPPAPPAFPTEESTEVETDSPNVTAASTVATTPTAPEPQVLATEDADAGESAPEPEDDTARSTVIVLGDGSPEGVAVVLEMSRTGHEVVSVEHERTAVGLRLAQLGAVIPVPGDADFLTALKTVAARSNAQAVLAARAEEMQSLAAGAKELAEAGIRVWTPGVEVFSLCKDRSALYDVLTSTGLPVEKTGLGPIEQGPVRGRQFSVDVISGRDFEVIAAVSSWRVVATGDTTSVAETFSDARLLDLVRAVCAAIRIEGPAVVQGYVSITGRAWLTEVRPGFSPLIPLARAAGVDIIGLALDGTMGRDLPTYHLTHRSGVRMIQFLDQVFEG